MTLEELRNRATATEITLIDTVIKLMEEELQTKVEQRATKFLMANRPPYRDEIERDPEAMRRGAIRFNEAPEETK